MSAPHRSTPAELKTRLAAERRGVPFLAFEDGDGRQQLVSLGGRAAVSVGRQSSSDIALAWDDEVSRAHADVECLGAVWTLIDDGRSRNGSFVNGERVVGRRPLHDGDVIRIGRTTIVYVEPGALPVVSTVASSADRAPVVSPAQRRVLVALCRPFVLTRFASPPSNQALAADLHLSVDTIKVHLRALFHAFGLDDLPQHQKRATLARRALEQGVVRPRDLIGPPARD